MLAEIRKTSQAAIIFLTNNQRSGVRVTPLAPRNGEDRKIFAVFVLFGKVLSEPSWRREESVCAGKTERLSRVSFMLCPAVDDGRWVPSALVDRDKLPLITAAFRKAELSPKGQLFNTAIRDALPKQGKLYSWRKCRCNNWQLWCLLRFDRAI